MVARQTTIESYYKDIKNMKENTQAKIIYNLLKEKDMTNNEIERESGYKTNIVTARVKLLRDRDLVVLKGYKHDIDTNKRNMVWGI